MPVTISKTVKQSPPRIPATAITEKIAGKRYNLSLVYIGETRAQSLNIEHRNKDYIPNILSFPLDESAGEIFICPSVARREAKNFNLSYRNYLIFLLIHGLLHLKGHDHGATMERLEQKYLRVFKDT
jgi:probable rRNA maturation factor